MNPWWTAIEAIIHGHKGVPARRYAEVGWGTPQVQPWYAMQFLPAFLGKLSSRNSQSRGRMCFKGPTFDVMHRKLSCPSGRWAHYVVCRRETACEPFAPDC